MSHHEGHCCCHSHDHDHFHDELHSHPHTHTHAHPHTHVHSHDHEHVHVHPHEHEGAHCHDHGHDHDHGYSHAHAPDPAEAIGAKALDGTEMSDMQGKLQKLLVHWLRHNADHAENYLLWAERARKAGMAELAGEIEEMAALTRTINEKIVAAQNRFFQK